MNFFRIWFIAISDEYIKAHIIYDILKYKDMPRRLYERKLAIDKGELPIGARKPQGIYEEICYGIEWLDANKEAMQFYIAANKILNTLDVDLFWRNYKLWTMWSDEDVKRRERLFKDKAWGYATVTQFPPVWIPNISDIIKYEKIKTEIKQATGDIAPDFGALNILCINVQYPKKEIMNEVEKIIDYN